MYREIILASGSPRRRELMDRMGARYIVMPSDREEDMSGHIPDEMVKKLSHMKAADIFEKTRASGEHRSCVIIGSDTVVSYRDRIMGKPKTKAEAADMIRTIAGDTHQVYTGVCILIADDDVITREINYSVCTDVVVTEMTDQEIDDYVATGEPMDKAGAYAIQGLFARYVASIRGDYYNIMGFPVSSVYHELRDAGIDLA